MPPSQDDEVTLIFPRSPRPSAQAGPVPNAAPNAEPCSEPASGPDPDVTQIRPAPAVVDSEATRILAAPVDPQATRVMPRAIPASATPGDEVTRIQPVGMDMTARVLPPSRTQLPPSLPKTLPQTLPNTLPGRLDGEAPSTAQVGRYLIKEELGRGGMAAVFRAHDPGLGRDVAIKFLRSTLCGDDDFRERFLREARAAGGLAHANIVTVHDVGEIDGRPYMAMELLVGESMADIMQPNEPLPLRDVLVMGIQLARALDYAHAHGIVHRDIKPGNIVRLRGGLTIKVTDFGIAHIVEGAAAAGSGGEQRTRVGDVLGTPQYMSPEQSEGLKLDGRSDLFSVGIVLYQMLVGRRPFEAEGLVALAVKIAKEEPAPLAKVRPDLPAQMRRIVERCLAKAPDRRFQSGRELADALSRVLVELDEAAREAAQPRIVPLRVKWAGMMAIIVAVVMGLTAVLIKDRQDAALMDQVSDYGASLARFIAAQNAVAALAEDWPVVEVAVQEIMKTGDFHSIAVIDRGGVVRASGNAALIGQPYQAPAAQPLGQRGAAVALSRYSAGGEPVLDFNVPITFQNKTVGRVALGLTEKPLVRVGRTSLLLMGVLVLVTVLAVAIAMYFVATWFARPIKQVREGLEEIARGHFGHRLAEPRKDEFGLLFAAYDRMAQALQDGQIHGGAPPSAPSMPAATASAAPAAGQGGG